MKEFQISQGTTLYEIVILEEEGGARDIG